MTDVMDVVDGRRSRRLPVLVRFGVGEGAVQRGDRGMSPGVLAGLPLARELVSETILLPETEPAPSPPGSGALSDLDPCEIPTGTFGPQILVQG